MRNPRGVLLVALALIMAGALLAWRTQTVGGTVAVRDVRWVDAGGQRMSGLLYVPRSASAESPAPGIVAVHGYINSRETQSPFAIEFARRGYVVLAIDQTGHGYSDPPAFSNGFGGPAALAYLRTLDFVDRDAIGLEGHSMGGWASGAAAARAPDDYRSIALVGSSTGSFGVPQGTPDWPRNIAVVFSVWDEFSPTMWGTPDAAHIGRTPKLQALFGTDEEVRPNTLYGSVEEGTARMLFQPRTNHPGEHLSRTAVGNAVEWFQLTLPGGTPIPAGDQIWYWKELGTLLSAAGMVLLLLPVGAILLGTPTFADLRAPLPPAPTLSTAVWVGTALATALFGPLTLFTFKAIPERIDWSPGPLFPQAITNGLVAWTTALSLITALLIVVGHFAAPPPARPSAHEYGLSWPGGFSLARFGRTALLALLVVGAGYLTVAAAAFLFNIDFRFWVFAIKPMSPLHLRMAVVYFLPFALFFLSLNVVLMGRLRRGGSSPWRDLVAAAGILAGGWIGLYLYQYIPLFARGTLAMPDEPLWTIISYQLLPVMLIVALLLTFFNRRTGTAYAGALASAILVAWIVVASQATHVVP